MTGIQAAFEGRLARDAELRRADGQAVLDFPVLVHDVKAGVPDEAEAVRVTVWGEEAEHLDESGALRVGVAVRVTGHLRLERRAAGDPPAGLNVSAWKVEVLRTGDTDAAQSRG